MEINEKVDIQCYNKTVIMVKNDSFRKTDASSDTSELEHRIDKLVYELYGLTDEEIAIVKGK